MKTRWAILISERELGHGRGKEQHRRKYKRHQNNKNRSANQCIKTPLKRRPPAPSDNLTLYDCQKTMRLILREELKDVMWLFFSCSQRAMLAAPCHLHRTKIIAIMRLFERCESSGGKHSHRPCPINTEKKHKESERLSALVFGFIQTYCFTHPYNVHHLKCLKEKGLSIICPLLI